MFTNKDNWGNQTLPGISNEELMSEEFARKIRYAGMGEMTRERNKDIYGAVKWIVRSPGSDLLEFYDQQNSELGVGNRAHSVIPPSAVFHIRFRMELPEAKIGNNQSGGRVTAIKNYCKQWKETDDNSYWGQVLKTRYNWLIDAPHTEFIFNSRNDAFNFLKEKTNQLTIRSTVAAHTVTKKLKEEKLSQMFWRGNAKGWSVIAQPE